jgi:hypothetical protein
MPRADQTVLDALLNEVKSNGVEVYVLETLPADAAVRADILSSALNTTVKAVDLGAGSPITGTGGINSATPTNRQYQVPALDSITLDQNMPGTPNFVCILTNAGGNRTLLIADTAGASQLQSGAVIDLTAFNHIVQTPQ